MIRLWERYKGWRHRSAIYDWAEREPWLLLPRETHVRLVNRWPERSRLRPTQHARHAKR
jgi:hypothetical protein